MHIAEQWLICLMGLGASKRYGEIHTHRTVYKNATERVLRAFIGII